MAAPPRSDPLGWRRDAGFVVLLLALTLAHWLPRLSGPIDLRYDGAVYYALGTSLARGDGYRLPNEPGAIEAIQYPPLLSLGIAAWQRLLGSEDALVVGRALRATNLALSLLYALLAYLLARRRFDPLPAAFAAALPCFTFHTLFLEDLCFSELPFTVVTLLAFLAAGARGRLGPWASAGLGVVAFFLRTAGVALLAAWTLEALIARRWRAGGLRAAVLLACVLAWQGHVARVRASPAYRAPAYEYQRAPYQFYNVSYGENVALLDPFAPERGRLTPAHLVGRAFGNAGRIVLGMGETVSVPRGFWVLPLERTAPERLAGVPRALAWLAPLLLGFAVLAGGVRLFRGGERFACLYVLGAAGLVALLPWPEQVPRYLAPVAPFLALALTESLVALARARRALALGLGGLVLATQAFAALRTFGAYHRTVRLPGESGLETRLFLFDDAREWRALYAGIEWLRTNTPAGACIASTSPHLVWLHASRASVMPPYVDDPAEAQRLLDTVPIDFILLDPLRFIDVHARYVEPVVRGRPTDWELAHTTADGLVTIWRRR